MKIVNILLLFFTSFGILGDSFLEDLMNRNPRNSDELIISASKILAKIIKDAPTWVLWIAELNITEDRLSKMFLHQLPEEFLISVSMEGNFENRLTMAFADPFEEIFGIKPISIRDYEIEVDRLFEEAAKDFDKVDSFAFVAKLMNLYERTMVNKASWSAPNRGEAINRGLIKLSEVLKTKDLKGIDTKTTSLVQEYTSNDFETIISALREHITQVFANVDLQYSGAIIVRRGGEKQLLKAIVHLTVTFEILENFADSPEDSKNMVNRMFLLLRVYRKAIAWRDPSCAVAELRKLARYFEQSQSFMRAFDTPKNRVYRMNMITTFIGQIDFEINEVQNANFRMKIKGNEKLF